MEGSEEAARAFQKECVKVAVNIRPLITPELLVGCTDCVAVVPGEPQVQVGSHAFTYDHVYGSSGSSSSLIFEECVAPLIDALFRGYNATVLAYGQTGSGKTYTMGTNYNGEGNCGGIIPKVMDTIFKKVDSTKDTSEFLIRVSFIEIFKEEVFDLLDPQPHAVLRPDGVSLTKATGLSRAPIQIRETANGGITLAGVTEAEVRSKEEMASYLARGSLCRATGSTNMNSQSSRSHAIFTICIEQKKIIGASSNGAINQVGDDILFSKFHLVDLAGSERAKRTGADGLRLKEGIHINRGLLALGNVISALGDEKKRKEGGHVPYRDSKLTRLLQDSLGGNSKTLMIACISPADSNAEETINTLKYANRARNIQNKAVINRDPMAVEMQRMRSQLEQLQAELLFCRGGSSSTEELQVLRHKITLLETRNGELHQELKEQQATCERFRQSALDAQIEKDKLIFKIESARSGKSWDEIDELDKTQDMDLIKGYISKIQELETELLQAQNFSNPCRNDFMDRLALEDISSGEAEGVEEEEKEREHSTLQDRLDKELQELDKRLEQKEAEMKQFSKVDTSVLKQHYEKKLLEMEHEKKLLQKEIEDLRYNLSNISSNSDESAQKLKEDYLQKLNMLETQVSELKKKQEAQSQLLRQKQKSDEASKRLQEEILRIKSQKVQLQNKIKQESEQFRSWKASREKEVLQLKKEGRKNEYEMHKLLALNQRQKMVLQRKTEEAAQATKRLKELLEAKKSSRDAFAPSNANGPGIQMLIQAIEHELEVTLRVHEVRSEYEQQMLERAAMAKEVAKLKEESEKFKQTLMRDCPQAMSPSARNSRIVALENMLRTSSSTLVSMASQLSEVEERERVFNGRGRWHQVRSLADAKNLMNYLFNLASSSRCQLRDKEASCREKDSLISELKEKVVRLNSLVRQLELQLNESRNHNWQISHARESGKESATNVEANTSGTGDVISYDLGKGSRPSQFCQGSRPSQSINQGMDTMEDMDISDSEMSDAFESDADPSDEYESDVNDHDWFESGKKAKRRQTKAGLMKKSISLDGHPQDNNVAASEEENSKMNKEKPDQCCTCSKYSYCKTKRCECRAAHGTCHTSCGCVPSKCKNREGSSIGNDGDVSGTEALESGGSRSSIDHADDEITEMVSHGTMLLQSAMTEVKPSGNNDGMPRKALSDIGNTMADQTSSKTNRRKKWRKSTIQLVPSGPPQSSVQQSNEASRNREDIPLRLPRALDSVPSDSNPPLTVRNSVRPDEPMNNNKDARGVPSRSPLRPRKPSTEKENHRL